MVFYATWNRSIVNNQTGFCVSVDNLSVSTNSPPGTLKNFTFEYMISPHGGFISYGGNVNFTENRAIGYDEQPRFDTFDQFYDRVQQRAVPGAYDEPIEVRERNQYTFEYCEEIGLTPAILREIFGEIENRLNDAVFDMSSDTKPLLK